MDIFMRLNFELMIESLQNFTHAMKAHLLHMSFANITMVTVEFGCEWNFY